MEGGWKKKETKFGKKRWKERKRTERITTEITSKQSDMPADQGKMFIS